MTLGRAWKRLQLPWKLAHLQVFCPAGHICNLHATMTIILLSLAKPAAFCTVSVFAIQRCFDHQLDGLFWET